MVLQIQSRRLAPITAIALGAWLASESLAAAQQQNNNQNLKSGTSSSTNTTKGTTTTTKAAGTTTGGIKHSTGVNPFIGIPVNGVPLNGIPVNGVAFNGVPFNGSTAFAPTFSPGIYSWQPPALPGFNGNLGTGPVLLNGHGFMSSGSNVAWLGSNPNNPYNPYNNPNLNFVPGVYGQPFGNSPLNPFGGGFGIQSGFPYGNPYMATGGYPLGFGIGNGYGNPWQPYGQGFNGNNFYGAAPGQFPGEFGFQPFGNAFPTGLAGMGGQFGYRPPVYPYGGGFGY